MTYKQDGYYVKKLPLPAIMEGGWEEELSGLKFILERDQERYINKVNMASRGTYVQKMFLEYDILKTLMELKVEIPIIVTTPIIHMMSPELRIPDGYYGTSAHQDWPSVQGSLDMVTVWIALTDAGVGNFPLEVIPGSHLGGLREGKVNGSVLEIECDDKDFLPIECKAGDVVFMSGFLIHRTGAGNGFRVAVSQRFDNAAEPTFIERGYPCAQKRVVDREIRWKPTPEQVKALYVG